MYSDRWEKDKNVRLGHDVHVYGRVSYAKWLDKQKKLVGVHVSFSDVDDFHYELKADAWNKFVTQVLNISVNENPVNAFEEFLRINTELFSFENALVKNKVKFKKIAYY